MCFEGDHFISSDAELRTSIGSDPPGSNGVLRNDIFSIRSTLHSYFSGRLRCSVDSESACTLDGLNSYVIMYALTGIQVRVGKITGFHPNKVPADFFLSISNLSCDSPLAHCRRYDQ